MRSKQCKGCDHFAKNVTGCTKNMKQSPIEIDGKIVDCYFWRPIACIPECPDANNGKGGKDSRARGELNDRHQTC